VDKTGPGSQKITISQKDLNIDHSLTTTAKFQKFQISDIFGNPQPQKLSSSVLKPTLPTVIPSGP
jgi:hypothetical protein